MFYGFKINFVNNVLSGLLVMVFVFLWSLLLIVPGIIASISYSMVPFILADNPNMDIMDVLKESKRITYGYKKDLFITNLSFLSWILLGVITCGIGLIFVYPYISATMANIYDDIKNHPKIVVEHEAE